MIVIMDDIINYLKKKKKYDKNIASYLIFDHILITTINKLALQKNKDKKEKQFILSPKPPIAK